MLKKKSAKDASYNPLLATKNAVDSLLDTAQQDDIEQAQKPVMGASRKPLKSNISINIEAEVAEKVRDYLFTVARRDETICSIATEALNDWIDRWEKKNGPIPKREKGTSMRGGRPPHLNRQ